jgi:hypothetical protein
VQALKTFIAAIIIFAILCGTVFGISAFILHRLSELSAIANDLPQEETDFSPPSESLLERTRALYALWDKSMRFFPYIMDYNMLERADEAALSLFSYAKSGEQAEFLAAKASFSDAIARLRVLFSTSLSSIA